MEKFLQDLRYGARMLVKSPGFTAVAVLSLALGIAANTTIFTFVNALFLNPIPVENPGEVVLLFTEDVQNNIGTFTFLPISHPNFEDYRDKNDVLSGMAVWAFSGVSFSSGGDPQQLASEVVSGNYFDLLGVRMARGRGFLPEEDKTLGSHPVTVISDGLWKRHLGSDPQIVGKTVKLNGLPFTVVGVTPPGFRGTNAIGGPDLWLPMAMREQILTGLQREWFNERRALLFFVAGRLKPGVSAQQAEASLKRLAKQLEQEYPRENEKRGITVVPLAQSAINPNFRKVFVQSSVLMMAAVGLVLLIGCANVANLLMVRATARQREMAIRLSLGAGRARLVRQLLTESIVLGLMAGVVGLLIAFWGRDVLWTFRPAFFNANDIALALDGKVLGFTLGLALLTGVFFGMVPAWQASRPDLMGSLKDRVNPPSGGGRWFGPRNLLVMAQVGLSLIALVGSGLFVRSLQQAQQINPGFETERLMVLSFDLGAQGYDRARAEDFYRRATDRLKTLPMVEAAAMAANAPFGGAFQRTVFREDADTSDRRSGVLTPVNPVQPDYFDTAGIPVLRGRKFTEADRDGASMVCIVNETMAKRFWPNEEAIGKRVRFFGETWLVEVIGIARDSKYFTIGEDPLPAVYFPLYQHETLAGTLHVRTRGNPAVAMNTIRSEVQALDRDVPLTNVSSIEEVMSQSLWAPRMGAGLLGIFGMMALVLAGIGIYGVMSYTVSQRTQEIGIRMALGAQNGDVLRLILKQGMAIVAVGLMAGLAAALPLTRGLTSLLFGISPSDPATFIATSVVLAGVAMLACYIPARRATRVDPIVALRYE